MISVNPSSEMKEMSKIDTNSYFSNDLFLRNFDFQKTKKIYKIQSASRKTLSNFIYAAVVVGRVFHLVPLSFSSEMLTVKFKIISWPVLVNVLFAIMQAILLNLVQERVREFFGLILHGTELYTFTYQTMMVYGVTLLVTILSVLRAKEFEKGWNSLMQLGEEMKITETKQLKLLQTATKVLWAKLIHCLIFSLCYLFYAVFIVKELCHKTPICYAFPLVTVICLGSNAIAVTIMLIFGVLFSTICSVIIPMFRQIHEEMAMLFKDPPFYSKQLTYQNVEHYRVLHARLCDIVGHFEGYFGLQALLLLCSGCFTITMGVYSNIHYFNNFSEGQVIRVVTLWALQTWASVVTMAHILISAEFLTNEARSPTRILNRVHHINIDARISKQVLLFNIKLGHFPLKISAFHITTISASFLATAITNIVTYVLVLFQFNLSIEDEQEHESRNKSILIHTAN